MSRLSIEGLQFSYGEKQVLKDLFLNVMPNEIYGFIGRNGAGKTTTIHCLLGYLTPQKGEMTFNDETIEGDRLTFKSNVGFVSDVPQFPPFYKAAEYLRFIGKLYQYEDLETRIEEILTLIDLKAIPQPIGAFSRGMRQRLAIGAAMLPKPQLLIMDEPTSALDPLGRDQVLQLMQRLKQETTILYSTHILEDAQRVSDRVGILEHGRLLREGKLDDLLKTDVTLMRLELKQSYLGTWPFKQVKKISDTTYEIQCQNDEEKDAIWAFLTRENLFVEAYYPIQKTLTSLYYEVLNEASN